MKLKKVFWTIVILILLYHISWFGVSIFKYNNYTEGFQVTENGKYLRSENGYHLSVKKPSYLSYTGNLAITNDKDDLSIIIWPLLNGDYEYGLQILDTESGVTYNIRVDSKLNYLNKENSSEMDKNKVVKLIDQRKPEIKKMLKTAKSVWEQL